MSLFIRPRGRRGAGEWWARCDFCHWSGPIDRFLDYERADERVQICDHSWCRCNDELRGGLHDMGFHYLGRSHEV